MLSTSCLSSAAVTDSTALGASSWAPPSHGLCESTEAESISAVGSQLTPELLARGISKCSGSLAILPDSSQPVHQVQGFRSIAEKTISDTALPNTSIHGNETAVDDTVYPYLLSFVLKLSRAQGIKECAMLDTFGRHR